MKRAALLAAALLAAGLDFRRWLSRAGERVGASDDAIAAYFAEWDAREQAEDSAGVHA